MVKLHALFRKGSLTVPAAAPDEEAHEEDYERSEWGHPAEFILSIIGYAVGLGNIWRFPYLAMVNGGAAFLIPYSIFMIACGIPLCYMEFTLGQFTGLTPVEAFKFVPLLRGLGWAMLLVSGMICIYYNIIMAWVVFYFTQSFTWALPWTSCDNSWNTPQCFSYTEMTNISEVHPNSTSSTQEYWNHRVLELSSGIEDIGGVNWHIFGCMIAAWVLTFICLCKGIKSSGKVVYVTALLPYVFLTILVIRGVTLPGASIGLKFYLNPDWSSLKSLTIWTRAAVQVFYALGPAWGGLITMSSYNRYNYKFNRAAIILPLACGGTSIFGGLACFSIVGHMAHRLGHDNVTTLVNSGPGLAFIAYPEALAQIPGAPIFTVLFFFMLFTLGLDTQFSTLETLTGGMMDRFPTTLGKHRTLFTLGVCCVQFLCGVILTTRAGLYYFQVFDWYATAVSVVLIAALEVTAISYIYGARRLFRNAEKMLGRSNKVSHWFWVIVWYSLTPLFTFYVAFTVVFDYEPPQLTNGQLFPTWACVFGCILASISLIPIPAYAAVEIYFNKRNLRQVLRPKEEWLESCEKRLENAIQRGIRLRDLD